MSAAGPKKQHVLVVDADDALRHELSGLLDSAGFLSTGAADGRLALAHIRKRPFDLVLLDLDLPRVHGRDVFSQLLKLESRPKMIILTSDNTPETLLRLVRGTVHHFIRKPTTPATIVESVLEALAAPRSPRPIEVISARPDWIELVVPCDLEAGTKIQTFLEHLDADLPETLRRSVSQAFHELLVNAIEWGGRSDPNRTVRIACVRAKDLLIYRIADPGPGFSREHLSHAAIGNRAGEPFGHEEVRKQKGLPPGGFGLLVTRAIVDELIYNEAGNEVVFLKRL